MKHTSIARGLTRRPLLLPAAAAALPASSPLWEPDRPSDVLAGPSAELPAEIEELSLSSSMRRKCGGRKYGPRAACQASGSGPQRASSCASATLRV